MKETIVILHGWGLRGEIYKNLVTVLKKHGFSVFNPDFPGFGAEPLPSHIHNLDDYVRFLHEYIKKKKIKHPILIGHSFGGRVAIKFCAQYPDVVSQLILTGVPVIRHFSFSKRVLYIFSKTIGKLFILFPYNVGQFLRKCMYYALGEWDYYKSGPLKEVFKQVINEDIQQYITKITIPVVLVWGKDDSITPVEDVPVILSLIPHAKSVIIPTETHKVPYSNPSAFFQAIKQYL